MNLKQYEFKVPFVIKVTSRGAISKSSMKAIFLTLFENVYKKKKQSFECFIKDSSNQEYMFTFEDKAERTGRWYDPYEYYEFVLTCELTEDESPSGKDILTSYAVDWADARHRSFDFNYAEYKSEVN